MNLSQSKDAKNTNNAVRFGNLPVEVEDFAGNGEENQGSARLIALVA